MKYQYTPPKILQKIFPEFIWNSSVEKILLTFDDGPTPETTDLILEELEKYNINALFFCVGENIAKYPQLVKNMISKGHTIGNHTYSHQDIFLNFNSIIDAQINLCNDAFSNITQQNLKYFRPPHGKFDFRTNRILKEHKLKNVMWSLLTYDYKNDLNIVKFSIKNYLTKNSIIVLHDNLKSKNIIQSSIKFIAETAFSKSYEFGAPTECLK